MPDVGYWDGYKSGYIERAREGMPDDRFIQAMYIEHRLLDVESPPCELYHIEPYRPTNFCHGCQRNICAACWGYHTPCSLQWK